MDYTNKKCRDDVTKSLHIEPRCECVLPLYKGIENEEMFILFFIGIVG